MTIHLAYPASKIQSPICGSAAVRAIFAAEGYLQRRTPACATIAQAARAFKVAPSYVSAALAAIRSGRQLSVLSGEQPLFTAAYLDEVKFFHARADAFLAHLRRDTSATA